MDSLVLVLLAVLPFCSALSSSLNAAFLEREKLTLGHFNGFIETFGKEYKSNAEFQTRYQIFKDNLQIIDRLNKEERGTATYGITKFSDMTPHEFRQNFTGLRISPEEWRQNSLATAEESEEEIIFADEEEIQKLKDKQRSVGKPKSDDYDSEEFEVIGNRVFIPKNFDWRKKNVVNPVKDQDTCKSCWAFTAISCIESANAIKHKKLLTLSEQELLDCDKRDKACEGGWMLNAYKSLKEVGGVMEESAYPYESKQKSCRFDKKKAPVKIKGSRKVPRNENKIAKALVKQGPLGIAIVATDHFQFYKGGIFNPSEEQCSRNMNLVNHGVNIVGYGTEVSGGKKVPYWIIRNSWSASWGEKGYIRVIRGKNACALKSFVSIPIVY